MRALRSLFVPDEKISGRAFLFWGLGLFLLKYFFDYFVASALLGHTWWASDYLFPRPGRLIARWDASPRQAAFLFLCIALPFIWVGVNLCIRRLRTLGWRPGWIACFFIPYVNLIFFAVLVFARSVPTPNPGADPNTQPNVQTALGPTNGILLVMAVAAASIVVIVLSTTLFKSYGFGLFLGIPFLTGFIPGLLHRPAKGSLAKGCFKLMLATQALIGACLVGMMIEGIICIAMASPIAIVLGFIGVGIGLAGRSVPQFAKGSSELGAASFLILPLLVAGEARLHLTPTVFKVTSSITIDAPPERVWSVVVAFPELPPPTEFIFRAGLAFPIRAEIDGQGVGAMRRCVFNTGAFLEPITIWDEPRLLRFSVDSNPPPLKELSFTDIHPPHLEGFFESNQGQFELKALPGGRTELIGTTWYKHSLWPETYWRWWSDHVIHTIHLRVLRHIKSQTETTPNDPL